ncbi:C6 transcription factor (PrnA), putative [Talaromyces stipitatus ATCC 10500]|uniref:C6 transcription factor (PrnA), putative n=1 Tax=Talaromyces stipitatus (strain ATCC 10500 / CBS 375.48 / QM 6759 / NRRL 1006) TaxID=441959 RepID=B8M1S3_TALSN|nr:C6 transcription factor (PrnA), putative [Talaromyces stipitatus ATCC 10500]EED22160.1 C6 transcription factor (PrnA), putative [Talaromyces stipitatus ATCC 10500]
MELPPPQYPPLNKAKRPRVAEENRKRAVRACDGCRRVKEKCEGGMPCRRCTRYHRQCIFNAPSEPIEKSNRHRQRTGSFTRDDETEAERVRYMERILAHYLPNMTFDTPSLRKVAEDLKRDHREQSESEGPLTQAEADDLDDLAIDEEVFSIRAFPDNTTQYSGEFSYLNFSMKIRKKIDEWMQSSVPGEREETLPFEERWRSTHLESGPSSVSAAIACLPPRYVAEFLINVANKYAQTNNFYVEEDWLRDKLAICYNDPDSLTSVDAASVCAILMLLAIGTQFAHMDSPTPVNKISREESSADDHRFSEDEVGLTFYHFASKLLPDIIATASVRSVQACLLIGTYLLPLDTSGLSYTYFGLAIKLAIQNGMHRKYTGEGLDLHMQEVRNRVFWTAFTIEKRISILHGRPASITDTDVDADLPVDLPSLHSRTTTNNHTNMVALIKLTLKLGKIAEEISSLRKFHKWQQPNPLENLLTQRRELIDWWSSLPKETSCRDLNPTSPLFRCNVHLKLDYCLTRIFMGRPFLFSNERSGSQISSQKTSVSRSKMRSILVSDCVEAALEIIDLCRLLRDEIGLARASYTEFSSCRAALLVILAQSLTRRTDRLRNALTQGMGLIKIMSMGIGSARSAVSVIEALERAIRRLEDWSEIQGPTKGPQDSLDSGYERFKNWEMLWKTGPISPATGTSASNSEKPPPVQKRRRDTTEMDFYRTSKTPMLHHTTIPNTAKPVDPGDMNGMAVDVSPGTTTELVNNNPDGKKFTNLENADTQTPDEASLFHQLDIAHSANSAGLPPMPHFGFEGFISNFPQELDEFTAISCFDSDFLAQSAVASGGSVDNIDNSASNGGGWLP